MTTDLFSVVERRRSIRQFTSEPIPDEWVKRALETAILAPNSSNVQTWDFHWFRPSSKLKPKIVEACLRQAAARTASHLVVVVGDPKLWKRSHGPLLKFLSTIKVPSLVTKYYKTLIPFTYRWGVFNSLAPIKWLIGTIAGLFRPMPRGPNSKRDLQEVAIKSAALAAENFVLAMTAQGGATCMMEGFDEWRLRRVLKLSCSARIVMVIGVGFESERGTWGPRFRLPFQDVVHIWD